MHKATFFIEIICHKLGGKEMKHTLPYSRNPDIAKHVAGKGYLIICFRFAFAKQAVFL